MWEHSVIREAVITSNDYLLVSFKKGALRLFSQVSFPPCLKLKLLRSLELL